MELLLCLLCCHHTLFVSPWWHLPCHPLSPTELLLKEGTMSFIFFCLQCMACLPGTYLQQWIALLNWTELCFGILGTASMTLHEQLRSNCRGRYAEWFILELQAWKNSLIGWKRPWICRIVKMNSFTKTQNSNFVINMQITSSVLIHMWGNLGSGLLPCWYFIFKKKLFWDFLFFFPLFCPNWSVG